MSYLLWKQVTGKRNSSGFYTTSKSNEYKKIDVVKTGWILLAILVVMIALCLINI